MTHTPGPWDHVETLSRSTWIRTGKPTHEAIECQRALAERDRLKAINAELVRALEDIDRWSISRDGTANADDLALRTIGLITSAAIAKAQPEPSK